VLVNTKDYRDYLSAPGPDFSRDEVPQGLAMALCATGYNGVAFALPFAGYYEQSTSWPTNTHLGHHPGAVRLDKFIDRMLEVVNALCGAIV
jgi:hypothetical protein